MGNTHRQCAVQIHNKSNNYVLCSPIVYVYSGRCRDALPSTVGPSESGSALFIKTHDTACGSVGVFTYDLYNESTKRVDKKMAVMFSNPYNFDFYSNLYAVGLFDRKQLCDHSLYEKMYYNIGTEFVRGGAGSNLIHERDGLTISANMTDTCEPELNVSISSRNGYHQTLMIQDVSEF
ncbi:DELTA-sagatoxin-Srs1a-like [Amphiprion ocellaris]|uniref:DELTA-sagatoxin-Srs1a-like n=1 Tax=Amphiprion ocellaris TaxID=80972 RepID=UPI0024110A81|nr:DELTA-sagatoxin-Srs1a-like [Amphiprion ocellaris]